MRLFVVDELFALLVVQSLLMITFTMTIIVMVTKRHYIITAEMAVITAVAQALASYAGVEWKLTFAQAILCLILAIICIVMDYKKNYSFKPQLEAREVMPRPYLSPKGARVVPFQDVSDIMNK